MARFLELALKPGRNRMLVAVSLAALVSACLCLLADIDPPPGGPGLSPAVPPPPLTWPDDPWRWACFALLAGAGLSFLSATASRRSGKGDMDQLAALFGTVRKPLRAWDRGPSRHDEPSWADTAKTYTDRLGLTLGPTEAEGRTHPGYRLLASVLLQAGCDGGSGHWVILNAEARADVGPSGPVDLPEVPGEWHDIGLGYGHAYAGTACLSLLAAAREVTSVPSGVLSWVARFDPDLYAAMSSLGRPSAIPEGAALLDHHAHEKAAWSPLPKPHVANAAEALFTGMSDPLRVTDPLR